MATPTYTLIEEQVLGTAAASVTFSSIPQTYKDLELEIIPIAATSAGNVWATINGDTGTNYSETYVSGDGTSAQSGRATNIARFGPGYAALTSPSTSLSKIQSYANTNVYKTVLSRNSPSSVYVGAAVNTWRSTAAVVLLNIYMQNGTNFAAGSVFRLWGVA